MDFLVFMAYFHPVSPLWPPAGAGRDGGESKFYFQFSLLCGTIREKDGVPFLQKKEGTP